MTTEASGRRGTRNEGGGISSRKLVAPGGVLISLRTSGVREVPHINSLEPLFLILGVLTVCRSPTANWAARLETAFAAPNLLRTELMLATALAVLDAALIAAAMARFQRGWLILE